jgi:putative endonuclease
MRLLHMNLKQTIGTLGETLAVEYLAAQGYEIIQCNYHCRYGEIDIVCGKDSTIIFVEVKSRTNKSGGAPEEAITTSKLAKLMLTIDCYCQEFRIVEPLRLDVVSVSFIGATACIKHYQNITQ